VAKSYPRQVSDANAPGRATPVTSSTNPDPAFENTSSMEYVQTEAALGAAAESLAGAPLVAVDTEAAGYHRYHDRICLLQLSTRTRTYVVDALTLTDLRPLNRLFADARTEVVLHDADYDLRLLARDHGARVTRLFDTKIAAQFLGEPQIGLAGLVEKHVGVKLDKKHQRADWAQRPLSRELLEYAAEDTRHLPALRDRLREELRQCGRLDWAEEEFALREETRWDAAEDAPDAYLRIKNARDLNPRQLAALRELHAWREDVARERDVAPFRVMTNEALVGISRRLPETPPALGEIGGISTGLLARRGAELLRAVRRARELPDAQLPRRPRTPRRPPPDPELERWVERLRRVRDTAAERLGLDRGFLMPRQQLEDIARRRPATRAELQTAPEMRRWQVAAVGDELLAAFASEAGG
jgi:ribonuclease D